MISVKKVSRVGSYLKNSIFSLEISLNKADRSGIFEKVGNRIGAFSSFLNSFFDSLNRPVQNLNKNYVYALFPKINFGN